MSQPVTRLIYNTVYQRILSNTYVIIPEFTNGFNIMNHGGTLAMVDGIVPLNAGVPGTSAGDSIVFGGNKGELFSGRLQISFPAGGVGIVVIAFKIYLNPQNLSQ